MNPKKILTTFALTLSFILSITFLNAHPSWGIVVNSSGEIFFSDVLHGGEGTIWKIDKKGRLNPIMKEYHAHPLHIDKNDVLWASANRYITGLIEGDGEHVLTKIHPNGKKEELIRTRTIQDYAGGNTTVTIDGEPVFEYQKQLYKRTKNGVVELLVDHTFDRLVTLYTAKDGSIYATDSRYQGGSIYRIDPNGKMGLYASNLLEEQPKNPPYKEPSHNLLYGMTEDAKGRIYVANSGSRRLLQMGTGQDIEVFYESTAPWFPVGSVFHNQTLYIMEVGYESGKGHLGPRILKVEEDKSPVVIADTDQPQRTYSKGSLENTRQTPSNWNRNFFLLLILIIVAIAFWARNHLFLLLPLVTLFSCSPSSSTAQEIPPLTQEDQQLLQEYQQLEAPHFLQLTRADEPGEELLVIGQLVDRETGKPIPNCRTFLYHTNAEGEYEQRVENDPTTSKIKGEITTDEQGRFFIKTILPADYPGKTNNRHIHTTFYYESPYNMDLFFEPFAGNGAKKWSKKSGHGVVMPLKKQGNGYLAFAKITVPFRP